MVGPAVELADQMLMVEVSLVKLKIAKVVLKLGLELEEDSSSTGGSLKVKLKE